MRSREFYTLAGQPEDIELLKAKKESRRQKIIQEFGISKEVSSWLDDINFQTLQDIFEDIARRTDLELPSLDIVRREDILCTAENSKEQADPTYGTEGLIQIPERSVRSDAKYYKVPLKLFLLYIICHEQVHAVTRTVSKGAREVAALTANKATSSAGYSRTNFEIISLKPLELNKEKLYKLFEEGLTEKLAQEVFVRYLKVNPGFAENKYIRRLLNGLANGRQESAYRPEVNLVNTFIDRAGKFSGFDEETVWHALLRDKLEARGFDGPELQDLVAEMTSPAFLDSLARAKDHDEIKALDKTIKDPRSNKAVRLGLRMGKWIRSKLFGESKKAKVS